MAKKTRQQKRKEQRTGEIGKHPDGGIVIGFISSGMVHHEFADSLTATCQYDVSQGGNRLLGPQGGFITMKSSPRIVRARTELVAEFLENFSEAKWFVTIDSDMDWDAHAIHMMIEAADEQNWPIVGGLCIAGGLSSTQYPTGYVVEDVHESGLPHLNRIDFTKQEIRDLVDAGAPLRVSATGAAFMAIRRDVLVAMYEAFREVGGHINPYPWYGEMIGEGGYEYGEDITFCLRAQQLGYDIILDTRAKIGHMKSGALSWETYKAAHPPSADPVG